MKAKLRFLLSLAIVLLFIPILNPLTASAGNIGNTGNNSFDTALNLSKFSSSPTTILETEYNEAFYKYNASPGEKIYFRISYQKNYGNMTVTLYDKYHNELATSNKVIDSNSLTPFIFVTADATSSSDVFYIKVTRDPTYTGNMYFSASVSDRIKSGNKQVSFGGTASVLSGSINLQGRDSSVITADLTKDTTIPKGAIVKNITTTGSQSPNQGNVTHKLMSNENQVWNTSVVSSSSSGHYNISLQDNLHVVSVWSFKYHVLSPAASTMSNVKANINYEYDVTKSFNS